MSQQTIAEFSATLPDGTRTTLADRLGKVVLVVNTASKCGLTPQYAGLEQLWRDYRDRGFEVVAFPCNQFAGQEPGDAEQIAQFCSLKYDVSFPLMAKIDVNGPDTPPLYRWLKREAPGVFGTEKVKWNFTKFLIGRNGKVVKRYAPNAKPEKLRADIERLL